MSEGYDLPEYPHLKGDTVAWVGDFGYLSFDDEGNVSARWSSFKGRWVEEACPSSIELDEGGAPV